jgi:hypothetical protein
VTDAFNDLIIGGYCEAAGTRTTKILQETSAAAFAFLRLCQMAGTIEDWHLDVLAAGSLHFRVLSFYRDHARSRLPKIHHGSSITKLDMHRCNDLEIGSPIVIASLASGQKIAGQQYRELTIASVMLNELFVYRSDARRTQRENTILRGVGISVCEYLLSRPTSAIHIWKVGGPKGKSKCIPDSRL